MSAIRVPASSANLGPGFDALGMALDLYVHVQTEEMVDAAGAMDGAVVVDQYHLADIAFRKMGGIGNLYVTSRIPMGRGLGFSGSVRTGGLVAAAHQRSGDSWASHNAEILRHGTQLEGHADNVAASLLGGVVVTAADRAIKLNVPLEAKIVVWIPSFTTSTSESRGKLPAQVAFDDVVFNIGRTSLLVAALVTGDVEALAVATQDRLHQDIRFAVAQPSKIALDAGLSAGAWCGWLSGSGPTVAMMCATGDADEVSGALPSEGSAKILSIDGVGTTIV